MKETFIYLPAYYSLIWNIAPGICALAEYWMSREAIAS